MQTVDADYANLLNSELKRLWPGLQDKDLKLTKTSTLLTSGACRFEKHFPWMRKDLFEKEFLGHFNCLNMKDQDAFLQ